MLLLSAGMRCSQYEPELQYASVFGSGEASMYGEITCNGEHHDL